MTAALMPVAASISSCMPPDVLYHGVHAYIRLSPAARCPCSIPPLLKEELSRQHISVEEWEQELSPAQGAIQEALAEVLEALIRVGGWLLACLLACLPAGRRPSGRLPAVLLTCSALHSQEYAAGQALAGTRGAMHHTHTTHSTLALCSTSSGPAAQPGSHRPLQGTSTFPGQPHPHTHMLSPAQPAFTTTGAAARRAAGHQRAARRGGPVQEL